jgi:hypothetical protein
VASSHDPVPNGASAPSIPPEAKVRNRSARTRATRPTLRRRGRGRSAAIATLLLAAAVAPATAVAQSSAYRLRPVERVRDPLVGRADLGGRVYEDRSADGVAPEDAPGIAGVVVALDDGRYAVTGPDGWWHMPEIGPGQRALAVRGESLPPGAIVPSPRHIGELPPGAFVRIDFPVRQPTETVTLGQPEILGHRAFPEVDELSANVVGNATDIQAIVNGVRVPFPHAEVRLVGLLPGDFVDPGGFGRVALRLEEEADLNPSEWRVVIVDAEGNPRREYRGDGKPPARLNLDGRDAEGENLAGPAAYAVRLCVDYGPKVAACSPYRPFGITGMEGRQRIQPLLTVPRMEPAALVNGEAASLDEDGSFIVPVRADDERSVVLALTRDDGRFAQMQVTLPTLAITAPAADFGVEWGKDGDLYTSPAEPGPIRVRLRGTAAPTGSRLQLGREPIPVEEGRWETEVEVPLGSSRFELILTDPRGWNVLHEVHFHLGDRSPEGEPLVVQPRIPDLEVHLPPADVPLGRDEVRIHGRAATDARVTASGAPVETDGEGRFDALVPVDESGRIEIVATDAAGRAATVERSWALERAGFGYTVWVDGEPYLRFIHSDVAEDASTFRQGLSGAARVSGQRLAWRGLNVFGGLSAAPADRRAHHQGPVGSSARTGAYAGAESWLGERIVAGVRYEGAVFLGGESDPAMRHDAALTGLLVGEAFDVLLDAGIDTGPLDADDGGLLAGGGLGLRWRAAPTLDVRARVGTLLALGEGDGGLPEILDASAQVTYRPLPTASPTVSLRYAHIEDNRRFNPEAAGDVVHLSLYWPLHDQVRLVQTLGGWFAGRGAFTALNVTRVEVLPLDRTLMALDYRLQTQFDRHEHAALLEGAYQVLPWLRVGGFYQFTAATDGGERSSRLQARLQAHF